MLAHRLAAFSAMINPNQMINPPTVMILRIRRVIGGVQYFIGIWAGNYCRFPFITQPGKLNQLLLHFKSMVSLSKFNAFAIVRTVDLLGMELELKNRDNDGWGIPVDSANLLIPPRFITS